VRHRMLVNCIGDTFLFSTRHEIVFLFLKGEEAGGGGFEKNKNDGTMGDEK